MKIEELLEQKDYTYFAYGKHYGRGGEGFIKVKFPASTMLTFIKYAEKDDNEKQDIFLDKLNHNVQDALSTAFETHPIEHVKHFVLAGKPFNGQSEEFSFGYGGTPQAAKEQFLKIDDEDDDKWDE